MRGGVVNTALVLAFLAFFAPTLEAQESEDEPQRGDIAVVKVKMNIAKIVVRTFSALHNRLTIQE